MDEIILMAIVVILLAAFSMPLLIHGSKINNKRKKARAALLEFASAHQVSFNEEEIWRNRYFLGIDHSKKILVYCADIFEGKPILIDLMSVHNLQVREISRRVGKEREKVVDKIEMLLSGAFPISPLILEIFDGEVFSNLMGEPLLASRWEKIINSVLSGNRSMDLVST